MARSKPTLRLVTPGEPDRPVTEALKATPSAKPLVRSSLGLDTEFLQQAGRGAGALAAARAAMAGLTIVGLRNGQPVVRGPDGTERLATWDELTSPRG